MTHLQLPCVRILYETYKSWGQCLENSSYGHSPVNMNKQVWQIVNQVRNNSCQDTKSLHWRLLKQNQVIGKIIDSGEKCKIFLKLFYSV